MSKQTTEMSSDPNFLLPQYGSMKIGEIITLGEGKNEKGDLFNKLVFDVFHVLGFCDPQDNIQKPGREIDKLVRHRTEQRVAIIESKSQEAKIGGDDINKFVGTVDAERRRNRANGLATVGYFASKSGFTTTALVQEKERAATRQDGDSEIILLGPEQLISELINGGILCPLAQATSVVQATEGLSLCGKADLLASVYGWIWVLYYSSHPKQAATHFAFVHADGNRLLNCVANDVLKFGDKHFANKKLLEGPPDAQQIVNGKAEAQKAYFDYLERELGDIQFDGMPADRDAGSVKVKLENVFVPLQYILTDKQTSKGISTADNISKVLTASKRVAILARPGGGKSTLIRRIALAYAFPNRRKKVDDDLPEIDLFPVYLRCRDLGNLVTSSITEIVYRIIYRAEQPQLFDNFRALVEDTLQAGNLLLLIDGLDEISNERERVCFVEQLRSFVATYPSVHLIVTSRETGFRAVAKEIHRYCTEYSIADLNNDQIQQLSFNWHKAILDDETRALKESNQICNIILGDERIKALAINPLLLTTLLFVKRWVGYLPTKRCTLYGEMIKLLLVSWNAVGHEKLDLEETEPQLAFIAFWMTNHGQQTITRNDLEQCIISARKELSDTLGYTMISPAHFIDQVEERSNLLIQRGLEENTRGELVPSYEFSHLSFQEYLTAKAIAETWLPSAIGLDIVTVLRSHIQDPQWLEVIPLTAVLSGRKNAKEFIPYLLDKAEKYQENAGTSYRGKIDGNFAVLHLANCIANEAPIAEHDLEKSIRLIAEHSYYVDNYNVYNKYERKTSVFDVIMNSKYGTKFKETIEKLLLRKLLNTHFPDVANVWIHLYTFENGQATQPQIAELLRSSLRADKIMGALLEMHHSYSETYIEGRDKKTDSLSENIFSNVLAMLCSDDEVCVFSAAWCIAWSGYNYNNSIPTELIGEIAKNTVRLWIKACNTPDMKRIISWALHSVICDSVQIDITLELNEAVERNLSSTDDNDVLAALYVGILTGMLTDDDVKRILHERTDVFHDLSIMKVSTIRYRFFQDRGVKRFLKDIGD